MHCTCLPSCSLHFIRLPTHIPPSLPPLPLFPLPPLPLQHLPTRQTTPRKTPSSRLKKWQSSSLPPQLLRMEESRRRSLSLAPTPCTYIKRMEGGEGKEGM